MLHRGKTLNGQAFVKLLSDGFDNCYPENIDNGITDLVIAAVLTHACEAVSQPEQF